MNNSFYIDNTVQLIGEKNIKIGENSVLSEQTWINVADRESNEKKFILGSNSWIGKRNLFTVGKKISIGPFFMSAPNCSFLCTNHKIDNPFIPYIISGVELDKEIIIGANCWFGSNSTVLGNVIIGHGCVIGASSVITKDIPPFSMVIGNPVKIIKRYSFIKKQWIPIEKYEQKKEESFEESILNENFYVNILKKDTSNIEMPIIIASSDYENL